MRRPAIALILLTLSSGALARPADDRDDRVVPSQAAAPAPAVVGDPAPAPALPDAEPALTVPELIQPDASLAAPAGKARLPTPLDADQIVSRIDKGMTAAGEQSTVPPDYAYGAFQRGFFLTSFSLALERAKNGDAPAQTLLGELLARGLGVKQDLAAAADWYGLAAGHGDPEAAYALGQLHLYGRGVKPDPAKGADFFEKAANQGNAGAAREFAYLLLQGKGRERNALLAAAYLRRAARLGDMDAQYSLGELYVEGVGVVDDEALAARWFGEAARNGHVGAQVEYGIILFNGRGVKKDEAVAARWFNEAANSDNPLAQVRLARLYAEGRGVDKDPAQAARWYLIAKDRGFDDDFMEDWLKDLDAQALAGATEAAARWKRFRHRPEQTAAARQSDGAAVDNSTE